MREFVINGLEIIVGAAVRGHKGKANPTFTHRIVDGTFIDTPNRTPFSVVHRFAARSGGAIRLHTLATELRVGEEPFWGVLNRALCVNGYPVLGIEAMRLRYGGVIVERESYSILRNGDITCAYDDPRNRLKEKRVGHGKRTMTWYFAEKLDGYWDGLLSNFGVLFDPANIPYIEA